MNNIIVVCVLNSSVKKKIKDSHENEAHDLLTNVKANICIDEINLQVSVKLKCKICFTFFFFKHAVWCFCVMPHN